MKRELPTTFSRDDYPKVDAALSRCKPSDPDAPRVFGLRFGREAATGLELEVHGSVIAYVEVKSLRECLCLRGDPIRSFGERAGYEACAPPRSTPELRLSEGSSYTLEPDEERKGHRYLRPRPWHMSEIFPHSAEVLRIDGRPVEDPAQIARAFDGFPSRPPAALRLRLLRGGELDLHYLSRTDYSGLWSAIENIRREHRDPASCKGPNILVDYAPICAHSIRPFAATDAWAALLPKLEKLARSPKRVAEAPSEHTKEACRDIAKLPSMIGFERDEKRVEFRYVQWLF